MSRNFREKWKITPETLPSVRRRCSGCGTKTEFVSSGKFRVNGNGRLLDVWLIYRCRNCKNTWNMAICQRVSPESIDRKKYEGFLGNSHELAEKYGTSREVFAQNGAEMVEAKGEYRVLITDMEIPCLEDGTQEIEIEMAGSLRLRADALFAGQWGITRSEVKKMLDGGKILCGNKPVSAGSRVRNGQLFTILPDGG